MKCITLFTLLTVAVSTAIADEPPELTRIRSSYQAELSRATKPITDKYRGYLQAQKAAATKAGKLEVALAYDNELQALDGTASVSSERQIEKAIVGHVWEGNTGKFPAIWSFTRDNIAYRLSSDLKSASAGRWRIDHSGVIAVTDIGGKLHLFRVVGPTTLSMTEKGVENNDGTLVFGDEFSLQLSEGKKVPRNLEIVK